MREEMKRPPIEQALETLFATPEPDAAFVARLEQTLLSNEQGAMSNEGQGASSRFVLSPRRIHVSRFFQWRWAAAGLLLVLVIALAAVGPRRVWAGIQAWLGYVPGVGFVDLEDTRVLLAPQVETRDGVTLRVEQVIAGPEETTVVIESEGLPPEDELWGRNGAEMSEAFKPLLRLPDGTGLATETFTARLGRATLVFPPLPADVYRVTLELPLLPLVPDGTAPEDWALALALQPATGELVAEMFPQPYRPEGATDRHHGITLEVLEVAHTAEKTVFKVRTEWQDEDWMGVRPHWINQGLYDDLGHVYGEVFESNGSSSVMSVVRSASEDEEAPPAPELSSEWIYDYAPVSLAANSLTFQVEQVEATIPASGQFAVDLGANPQVGDSWDVDIRLQVAGLPVHISRVWLDTERLHLREGKQTNTVLNFHLEPALQQDGRSLEGLQLRTEYPGFGRGTSRSGQVMTLRLEENAGLPQGVVNITIEGADVTFHGPWLLEWQIPQIAEWAATPVILHPQAVEAHNGVTLRLDEVVMTDRVTAVEVSLAGAPEGAMINHIRHYLPGDGDEQPDLFLEDDRLDRYHAGPQYTETRWQPEGWEPPSVGVQSIWSPSLTERLQFPGVHPLAQRLTLHIPGLDLLIPGEAAFTVALPDNVPLAYDEEARRFVSEPWPVDIAFTVAGYDLHFTEAQLSRFDERETRLVLLSERIIDEDSRPLLTALVVENVIGPDDQPLTGANGRGFLSPIEGREGSYRVGLAFNVDDPASGAIRPGRYQVRVGGIMEMIEGPWTFSWPLEGAEAAELVRAPYSPGGAVDSHDGFSLHVMAVAHAEEETALQVQARWVDASWEWAGFEDGGVEGAPVLRDEDGRVYETVWEPLNPLRIEEEVIDLSKPSTPASAAVVAEDTVWFEPISPSAGRLALQIDSLRFTTEPSGSFMLDLGPEPRIGDSWPLDVALDVGGFPVHINGAQLEAGEDGRRYKLSFRMEVEQSQNRILETLLLHVDEPYAASSTRYTLAGELNSAIHLDTLPDSPFTVNVDSATMAVMGPWEVRWDVPDVIE